MVTLADFIDSPLPPVRTAAQTIRDAQRLRDSHGITGDEYADLCRDALRLDRISVDMADLALRQEITEAFNVLCTIAGVAGGL
jgi:hypothetical protein